VNNFKKYFVALFLLSMLPVCAMEQQDPNNNNGSSWNVISRKKTAPMVKTKKQLAQESLKFRRYDRQAVREAKQEAIRKGKEEKEKIQKSSLKNMVKDVQDDEKNNIVTIQDHANHQILYLLKRDQEIPVESFKDVDRAGYLIGEQLVDNNNNYAVKTNWNHNFNPLVKEYLKYGEPDTHDVDGCHQYVIVGAIADNNDWLTFDCGEFEYAVKNNEKNGTLECYHHCFRTKNCKYISEKDRTKLEDYHSQKIDERKWKALKLSQKKHGKSDYSEK